jgi:G:T-mismatch repair DNA endonuclease (very short patch repair protein)
LERYLNQEYKNKWYIGFKKKFNDPEYIKKHAQSLNIKPNKQEIYLSSILGNNFKYIGDFSFWIDGKNPDFINEDKKLVIDFFGDHWHGEKWRQKHHNDLSTNEEHELQRIEHFEKNGYHCLVIWEHELKDIEKVKEKINEFCNKY